MFCFQDFQNIPFNFYQYVALKFNSLAVDMETSLICPDGKRLVSFNVPDIFRVFHGTPEEAVYEQRSNYFREWFYQDDIDYPVVRFSVRCYEGIIAELPGVSY